MKKIILFIIALYLIQGCGAANNLKHQSKKEQGEVIRDTNPNVSLDDQKLLIQSQNRFAFKLYNKIDKSSNTLISPTSITNILMMEYLGSHKDTQKEFEKVLDIPFDRKKGAKVENSLNLALNFKNSRYTFETVNAIFASNDYKFKKSYLNLLMENFGTKIESFDFINKKDYAVDYINNWVSKKTDKKIENIVSKHDINSNTKMILVNSSYFKSYWANPFPKDGIKKAKFNNKSEVKYLTSISTYKYYEDENIQALKIPYKYKSSMIVIKNRKNQDISYDMFDKITKGFKRYRVEFWIPKFRYQTKALSLKKTLNDLGLKKAFSYDADFLNMSDDHDLFISDILHKTYISIDEYGTQAAAVTISTLVTTGIEDLPTATLKLDKPFSFIISDNQTNQILFIGKVINPLN